MKQEIKEMVEKIMDTNTIGYAYVYPLVGGNREEYLIATTPKNLASFIGSHFYDAEKMVITDMMDRLIVNTCGGFLDHCPDQRLCAELVKHLAPIQMGEEDAGEILAVERAQAEEYWEMEDKAVAMAEHCMG